VTFPSGHDSPVGVSFGPSSNARFVLDTPGCGGVGAVLSVDILEIPRLGDRFTIVITETVRS
jgi:hypothetical protein